MTYSTRFPLIAMLAALCFLPTLSQADKQTLDVRVWIGFPAEWQALEATIDRNESDTLQGVIHEFAELTPKR